MFFLHDAATTAIYTLSLHDALPISRAARAIRPVKSLAVSSGTAGPRRGPRPPRIRCGDTTPPGTTRSSRAARRAASCKSDRRSEEHTSELQSQFHLVCRLLLEKKKR